MPSSTSSPVNLPPENVKLEVDPLRFSQVIGNLLTNAAKYTDPEGRIALQRAHRERRARHLASSDSGIGLTPEAMPGLFTMFSQVNSAIDRAEGGLGIGLALVKGLVALHGGRVEVRSEGLGRGSEFIVHLPHQRARDAGRRERADRRSHRRGERQRRAARARARRRRQSRRGRVARARAALRRDTKCSSRSTAPRRWRSARASGRSAAIIDIGMPGMSGHEVARRIRLEAWGKHAVLIALTGWGQDQDKQAAMAAGFDEHMTKPVDPEDVERVLASRLRAGG